jgi:hypothetical protein
MVDEYFCQSRMRIREFFQWRAPEIRREHRIEFLGEQDGEPERRLKSLLTPGLAGHPSIRRAYLAQLGFAPNVPPAVALCLVSAEEENAEVVDHVGRVFNNLFASGIPLDIVFVSAEQEAHLARVCSAFYSRAG